MTSTSEATPTISYLCNDVKFLPNWHDHTSDLDSVCLGKVTNTASPSSQLLVVTHTILVKTDLLWKIFVHSIKVKTCVVLSNLPPQLDRKSLNDIIYASVAAFVDHYAPVSLPCRKFYT